MSQKFTLEASPRDLVGKKVKQLRKQGMVPAVVYGPGSENMNITVNTKAVRQVLMHAGGTQLIEINVDGSAIPTLARSVQRDHVRGELLHIDFYRVAMDRLIRADIPLNFVGESPLEASNEAIVVTFLSNVEVEALPGELPPSIEVDTSILTEIGQHILVSDLVTDGSVRVTTDPTELVVRLDHPHVISDEEEPGLGEEELSAGEVEVIRERHDDEEDDE